MPQKAKKNSNGTIATKTNPALWNRLKAQVKAGSKGGRPGQWSARKAQLLTQKYKAAGGKFKGKKSSSNSLRKWSRQKWDYTSGKGSRYLPESVRKRLKPGEKRALNASKRKATRQGKQRAPYPKSLRKRISRAAKR